jgi:hypothetical protein
MHETYEERRFIAGPGEWETEVARIRAAADVRLYGLFRGQIGLESNEGIVLTVSPEAERIRGARMVATVRPAEPTPPKWRPGVYAFRSFDTRAADADEFVDLSQRAWPEFESGYDAQIIGLWRSLDVNDPVARFHLLTRYASLATWEASRADVGRPEFARRAKLTRATRVVTATLA